LRSSANQKSFALVKNYLTPSKDSSQLTKAE